MLPKVRKAPGFEDKALPPTKVEVTRFDKVKAPVGVKVGAQSSTAEVRFLPSPRLRSC